jgi:hypothetical protein
MNLDIDFLINLMSPTNMEMGEQDSAPGSTSSSGGGGSTGGYPTVTKWETGVARGLANQIDAKSKWNQLYTIKRGKANTLL